MNYIKTQFILDETNFLSDHDIEYRYDYYTLKYTHNLRDMERFLKDQFNAQSLENIEFINYSGSQGEKSFYFSVDTPVKKLKEEREKKESVYFYAKTDNSQEKEIFFVQIRG